MYCLIDQNDGFGKISEKVIVGTASIIHRISKTAFVLLASASTLVRFEEPIGRQYLKNNQLTNSSQSSDVSTKKDNILTRMVKDGYFFFQDDGFIDYETRLRVREFKVTDKYLLE